MRPRLPPLNGLKAFEAAAGHESFTRAAEELCVTQGAVSHQVKALEAELAVKLFNRERQRLLITEAGHSRCDLFAERRGHCCAASSAFAVLRQRESGAQWAHDAGSVVAESLSKLPGAQIRAKFDSHMLDEQPRLFFLHFWANDAGVRLTKGLRAALDKIGNEGGFVPC